jgi:hypothetical protein
MPRPLGDGKADSAQQRARFFGYKGKYFQYCRVYLERNVLNEFVHYVEHEEIIHDELLRHRGEPLQNWNRIFFLRQTTEPTRRNVVGFNLRRSQLTEWVLFNNLADDEDIARANEQLVYEFISSLPEDKKCIASDTFPDHFIDRRTGANSHKHILFEGIDLDKFIKHFLDQVSVISEIDKETLEILRIFFNRINSKNICSHIDIFVMRAFEPAERGFSPDRRINPFQGRSPSNQTDLSKLTYGGDQSFKFNDRVTLQIHFLNINETTGKNSNRVRSNCPWLCFYVPDDLARTAVIGSI